jgi:hypothetical protein
MCAFMVTGIPKSCEIHFYCYSFFFFCYRLRRFFFWFRESPCGDACQRRGQVVLVVLRMASWLSLPLSLLLHDHSTTRSFYSSSSSLFVSSSSSFMILPLLLLLTLELIRSSIEYLIDSKICSRMTTQSPTYVSPPIMVGFWSNSRALASVCTAAPSDRNWHFLLPVVVMNDRATMPLCRTVTDNSDPEHTLGIVQFWWWQLEEKLEPVRLGGMMMTTTTMIQR